MAKILVLAAIAQVFALAIVAKVMQQTEAVNLIVQKAALVNVQRDIEKVLSHPSGCLAALQTAVIEESRLVDPNYRISLNRIFEPGLTPRPVIVVGQTPYGMSGRARIEALEVTHFTRVAADVFEGDFILTAKVHTDIVTGYPMRVRMEMSSSKVKACSLLSAAAPGSPGTCRIVESGENLPARADCATTEKRISGGGSCLEGYMTMNEPIDSGGLSGWLVDCRNRAATAKPRAKAIAYCCTF